MARARPTVLKALRAELPREKKILVAVSGGADSMALLHAAHTLRSALKIELAAAHIDHALRPESADDLRFVRTFCEALDVPFHGSRLTAPATANIESWARAARYRALQAIRRGIGFDWILTAHTANDVAETLLMRLVSNKDLGSIAPLDPRRKLIRPLLTVPRAAVLSYLHQNRIPYREDVSNSSLRFLRNRVRHKVLQPLIEEFGDGVVHTLALQARRLDLERGFLLELSMKELDALAGSAFGSKEWMRALRRLLADSPGPLRERLVGISFSAHLNIRFGLRERRRLLEFIESGRTAIQLPGGVTVRRRQGGLAVETVER